MKRVVTPELLDEDLGTPQEIQSTLLDLRGLNQNFGGFSSMSAMLRTVAQEFRRANLSFLDVAGGTGDLAEHVTKALYGQDISIRPAVLDRAISHMRGNGKRITRIAGDALSLPFGPSSFDVVGCNLFCHHLEPEDVISFFNEALRVSRLAVVVSDLRRNLFHWFAAYAGYPTYRSRLTRNDAPASVRRAYTIEEIQSLAARTCAARSEVKPYYFQRLGVILWKAQS